MQTNKTHKQVNNILHLCNLKQGKYIAKQVEQEVQKLKKLNVQGKTSGSVVQKYLGTLSATWMQSNKCNNKQKTTTTR